MGEPGTLYAAQAGVASIDHATQLSDETMRLMREKHIPAVPTFAIFDYFAQHATTPAVAARERPARLQDRANSKSRLPPDSHSQSALTLVRSRTARRPSRWN